MLVVELVHENGIFTVNEKVFIYPDEAAAERQNKITAVLQRLDVLEKAGFVLLFLDEVQEEGVKHLFGVYFGGGKPILVEDAKRVVGPPAKRRVVERLQELAAAK